MNNYEHLIQGGIDALVEFIRDIDPAFICSRNGSGEIGSCNVCHLEGYPDCLDETMREWLEAEYKEQDSFDELLLCLDRAASGRSFDAACRYHFGDDYLHQHCELCVHEKACSTGAFADIARRIRELLEEE